MNHRIKSLIAGLLLASCSLVLFLGLTEISLRLYHYSEKNRAAASARYPRQTVKIANSYGMRRFDTPQETPPEGTLRILSYGDSIGVGFRVDDRSHYPYLIEKYLNENARERTTVYEVLNMARGYSPTTYAVRMKKAIQTFKPHHVLMEIELLNDLGDEVITRFEGRDEAGLPRPLKRLRYWPGWRHAPRHHSTGNFFQRLQLNHLLYSIKRHFGHLLERIRPNPLFKNAYYYNLGYDKWLITQEKVDHAFDEMFITINNLEHYLEERGIGFTLLILPSKYIFEKGPYHRHAVQIYEKALARAGELEIPHLSLREPFAAAGGQALYLPSSFCHPLPEGYDVIARTAHQHLETLL